MSTDRIRALRKRLRIELERLHDLEVEGPAIRKESVNLMHQYERDLQAARPELAPSTSKEECLEAAEKLIKHGRELSAKQKPQRDELSTKMIAFHSRRLELHTQLQRFQRRDRRLDEDDKYSIDGYLNLIENLGIIQCISNEGNDDLLIQGEVQKIMENQGEEEKHWVLLQNNPFIAHLDRPRTTPCPGTVSGKRATPNSNSNYVPPEIAEMVLMHCDLEGWVKLREVNSVFYSFFFNSEQLLRDKVMRRYPWFHREEDIFTWAECVLVYVKRMTGKKWSTTDDLSKLTAKRKLTPVKTLLPREIKEISDWEPSFAPFSVESEGEEFWELEVSVNQEGETVVKPHGFDKEIILPPGTEIDPFGPKVELLRHTLVVRSQARVWVFFQSDPHYKRLVNTHSYHMSAFEFPMVFGILKDQPLSTHTREAKALYQFLDNRTGQLREFAPPTLAKPVGLYNGLMWWMIENTYFVPTFVDLANPGKIYYRKDKIITVAYDEGRYTPFYQCNRGINGSSRFLTSFTRGGMLLIDLATSTVTEVVSHTKDMFMDPKAFNPGVELLPGFVNEKLDVRFIDRGNFSVLLRGLKGKIEEYGRFDGEDDEQTTSDYSTDE